MHINKQFSATTLKVPKILSAYYNTSITQEKLTMVYCTKCGTQNPDTATTCSNCGAPIYSGEARPYTPPHWQGHYYDYEYRHRSHGGEGFGLLIAGLFILIIGLAALTGFTLFWVYFWPLVIILIGVWIIFVGLRRNRRYRQAPPP
jgi:hypothetical protein